VKAKLSTVLKNKKLFNETVNDTFMLFTPKKGLMIILDTEAVADALVDYEYADAVQMFNKNDNSFEFGLDQVVEYEVYKAIKLKDLA
jgi:hypothetical protein